MVEAPFDASRSGKHDVAGRRLIRAMCCQVIRGKIGRSRERSRSRSRNQSRSQSRSRFAWTGDGVGVRVAANVSIPQPCWWRPLIPPPPTHTHTDAFFIQCVAIRHDASTFMHGCIVTDRNVTHAKRIGVGRTLISAEV